MRTLFFTPHLLSTSIDTDVWVNSAPALHARLLSTPSPSRTLQAEMAAVGENLTEGGDGL